MKKLAAIVLCFIFCACYSQKSVRVGSKHFTEGYILSEMISQILEANGYVVERKFNLGGTLVCFEALKNGEIDVYPEYTGTITKEIFRGEIEPGFEISKPYGFNNTYSLVVRSGLKSISELKDHPGLKAGISYEFLKRQDGWDALAGAYNLPQQPVGLEHGLAYQALMEDKIDITDCYSTDGEISVNKLVVLKDDKNFFSKYEAVSFYKKEFEAKELLDVLTGKITEAEMSAMNAEAIYAKRPFKDIAADFLLREHIITSTTVAKDDFWSKLGQHLMLTFVALALAILIALPLGILLYWNPGMANIVLYLAGLMQTIPSIALLAMMIPVFGIGSVPAIVALLLYAILPILRNTVTGLRNVDPLLKEAAAGLGMSQWQALKFVEFPLAASTIIAGIRIAAVINVGTATLAAFIGAGGLGEYIVTGLALNNTPMILKGALPAAVLALAIELIFEFIERRLVVR